VRGWALIIGLASLASVAGGAACGATAGDDPGAGGDSGADGTVGSGSFGAFDAGGTGVDAGDPCGRPATPIPELTGLTKVRGVVVVGDDLFVAHAKGLAKCSTGTPPTTCTTTTFAEPPDALAGAGANVVVAHGTVIEECQPSLMTGGAGTGCTPIRSSPEVAGTDALAVTGADTIHFTAGGTLHSAVFGGALIGSVPTGLARGNRLSSSGARVFFTASGGVRARDALGGVTEILGAPQASAAEDVFAASESVCITTGASSGAVLECSFAGCAIQGTVAHAEGRKRPHHVVKSDGVVLFTDLAEGTLSRGAQTIAACLVHPRHVARARRYDGDAFLAVNGPADDTGTADIVRIPVPPPPSTP